MPILDEDLLLSPEERQANILAEYNSIPEYGALSRLFSKEKNDAYNRKQEISQSQEYKDAIKNNPTIHTPRESASWAWDNLIRPSLQILMDDETYKGTPMSGGIPLMANPLASKPMQGIGALVTRPVESAYNVTENVEDYLAGRPIKARDTLTETLTDSAVSDLGKYENVGRGLLSTGDTAVAMGISALTGNPQIGRIIQTLEQSADVMDRAAERGLNPNQIMAEGVLSGAVTYATEKIPFETALDIFKNPASKGVKAVLKAMVKGGLPEAGQEAIEEICDVAMEMLVERDKSDYVREIKSRVMNGDNPLQVAQEISGEVLKEAAVNAIWGFIGGGLFGAGASFNGNVPSLNANEETNVEEKAPEISNANVEENISETKPVSDDVQNHIDDLARQQNDLAVELADVNSQIKKTNGDERRELRHRASALKQEIANIDNQINSVRETGEIPSANVPVEENVESTPQEVLAVEPQTQAETTVQPIETIQETQSNTNRTKVVSQPKQKIENAKVASTTETVQSPTQETIIEPITANENVDASDDWENRTRKAVYESPERMKTTQYVNNTLYDLPTVKNNKDVQMFLKAEEENGTLGADVMSNTESTAQAIQNLSTDPEAFNKAVDSKMDLVESGAVVMDTIQLGLDQQLEQASKSGNYSTVKESLNKVVKKIHNIGQALQALAKYTNTASSALTKTEAIASNDTKGFSESKKNRKAVAINRKLANALTQNNNDAKSGSKTKVTKTHEEIIESVRNTLAAKNPDLARKATDADVEFIANMLEANTPVDIIRDEIEHWIKHGEWYPLDKRAEIKPETFKKLDKILAESGNKLADIKKEIEPLSQSKIREQIRASLAKEFSSVSDRFTEKDIDFIIKMFEENIPKWQIRDEIEHFIREGEWYTLDESIENPKPMSREISKALDILVNGETEKTVKAEKTVTQIEEEIRNRLDEEPAGIRDKFSDSDIEFLANRIKNGISAEDLANLLNRKVATGYFEISDEDIEEVNNLYKNINSGLLTSRERAKEIRKANAILAKYVGNASFMEKWHAWRYLSMLGNTRTHIRNIIGNTAFGTVTNVKDNLAGAIEEAIDKISKDGIDRTKAVISRFNPEDNARIKAGEEDFENNVYERADEGNKYDEEKGILKEKRIFKTNWIENLNKLNSDLLTAEDMFAIKRKYARTLASYLKANGKSSDILKSDTATDMEFAEKARTYALEQAKIATFHEDNELAERISNFVRDSANSNSKASKAFAAGIEGVLPFRKTPANILKQGAIEYNPLQLIKALTDTAGYGIDKARGVDTKNSPAEIIDTYARGMTGSAIFLIGAFLASRGLIRATGDEEDDLWNEQNYSLNIGEHSYTIDWLAPSALPLFMGAAINEWLENKTWSSALDILLAIGDPVIEMSMLSGLSNTFTSMSRTKDKTASLAALGSGLMSGYLSQAVPTIGGQFARAIDKTRRDTYAGQPYGSPSDAIFRQLRKDLNKIPFASYLNEPYINAFGEKEENVGGNFLGRLLYNMASPGYYENKKISGFKDELRRLQNSDEVDVNFLPSSPSKTEDKEPIPPKQYEKYAEKVGKSYVDMGSELVQKDGYSSLPDATKAEILQSINSLSKALAKRDVLGTEIAEGSSNFKLAEMYDEEGKEAVVDYLLDKKAYESTMDKYGITQNDTTREMYDNNDTKAMQKYAKALDLAKKYGKESITETEWKIYNTKGTREFEQYVKASTSLKNADISNNAFARNYYQLHGDRGLQTLEKAYEEIPTIKIGVDEYGDDKYLEVNEKTFGIWEDMGKRGVEGYAEVKYTDVNNDGSISLGDDMIPTLEDMYSYTNEEKGRLLEEANGSIAKGAQQAYEDKGYDGIYMYYLIKYSAPSTKSKEIKQYIDRMSLSPAEKEYYKSLF